MVMKVYVAMFVFWGFWGGWGYTAHLEVIVTVVVGFSEDRMMDMITGRPSLG